ncbi:MAG: tRNA uridine-5-carboxymethylaminomethyl(34) synthesis GTPase MnmE [Pseudomonadota bacterium]
MNIAAAQTIFALASAPGKAGVAVFRISGPEAVAALTHLGVAQPLTPRLATLVTLRHGDTPIDQALALFFPAPYSFTGEDIVELHTHGSRAVTKLLYEALSGCFGLRMADAGEFARRAFRNGKLDLAQAEGLADLIDADTRSQHAQALRQIGGDTTRQVEALRMAILEPLALMEAYIDFPEEEIPDSVLTETTQRVEALVGELRVLLDDGGIGEKIREGLDIVIIGPPNAGKSSLLNALAKRDAAIVSAEAGTTRDLIEIQMEIGGYAVTLVDTAGIRDTAAEVESEGIRRALHRAAHADLTVRVADITTIAEQAPDILAQMTKTTLVVATKSDLGTPLPALPFLATAISTQTQQGISELVGLLHQEIAARMESVSSPLITRARHREAMAEALSHLARFRITDPLELICEDLRLAAQAIGKITGKIMVDELLDLVFSRFCIGK